jgi:hypothetical protein
VTGGVVVGRQAGSTTSQATAAIGAAPVAGAKVVSATEPSTGARLTATVQPAAGWVRVNASVTGVPAGQRCRLVVVTKDGHREIAGSWVVSAAGERNGTNLDGSAIVNPAQVAVVTVENTDGEPFVSARI